MKIFIHGRKNGYTVLYPKPTPPEFYAYASDIQSISANNYGGYYGKTFYTLAFVDGGCVFTKYIIGEDVGRGQLGEIGISVFVPNTQKLSGNDVKALLDELINIYANNYITNNKIEEPKNGFNWSLFTSMADAYDRKLQPRSSDYDSVMPGTQDPAYYYFKSDSELIEHLDKPFQEEYNGFRQILLIDSNLQGISNPLNVLRNSGVEVSPDLKNEYYYLNNYKYFKGLSIIADGKPRSDEKHNNRIRAKWQVEIRYTKDYYKPIVATGTVINRDSDIHKYLEVKGNNLILNYDALKPVPETKRIVFDVVTKKDGVKVTDAEIQIDSQSWQNIPDYTFSAEELGREHKIAARKGDNLISDIVRIIPQNCSEPSIHLPLVEKRVVKISVTDQENGNFILQFRVYIAGKVFNDYIDQIEFIGDEINKEWDIEIKKFPEYDSESKKFCPAREGNEIIFRLSRSKRLPFKPFPPDPGWVQQGSRQQDIPKSFARKAKTIFSKPAVVAGSIVSALVFLFGILALFKIFGNENGEAPCTTQRITEYVNGNTLHPDTLNSYKDNWKKKEQDFISESGVRWFGGENKIDSAKWENDWKPTYESIEQAIKKRELIKYKNFTELKNLTYSEDQEYFKNAIGEVNDSIKVEEVKKGLGNVTHHTLDQIADSIYAILSQIEQKSTGLTQEPEKAENKPIPNNDTPAKSGQTRVEHKHQDSETGTSSVQIETTSPGITSEIIQYIKGNELDEDKLNEYKSTNGINLKLQNSIQLCLDFWELNGQGTGKKSKTYYNFRNKVDADDNFKNSKLKAFLDEMCQPGASPDYSDQEKIKGLK